MIFGKDKTYYDVKFSADVLIEAARVFEEGVLNTGGAIKRRSGSFHENGEDTTVENPDESCIKRIFSSNWSDYRIGSSNEKHFVVFIRKGRVSISVQGFESLSIPDSVIHALSRHENGSRLSFNEIIKNTTIFIGHGRSRLWRDLKDHLQDHHGLKVVAYETGARAGYTIQEVLNDMTGQSDIAFLILTGEDVDVDGVKHARENVVHETGLFQGKLGFKRAIVALEDGTTEFSNIAGLQQIRFQKGNIKEIFGDVLSVLRREFGDSR